MAMCFWYEALARRISPYTGDTRSSHWSVEAMAIAFLGLLLSLFVLLVVIFSWSLVNSTFLVNSQVSFDEVWLLVFSFFFFLVSSDIMCFFFISVFSSCVELGKEMFFLLLLLLIHTFASLSTRINFVYY